jgi:transcriptional regulator with XRE-family HTH domain
MDQKQAKKLGKVLEKQRLSLGLSTRQLGTLAKTSGVTVLRIERGDHALPSPNILSRIATSLGLSVSEVYSLAGYGTPAELPAFLPYMRTKYQDLPLEDIQKIQAYAARLAKKHGVSLSGPAPGEDEAPE